MTVPLCHLGSLGLLALALSAPVTTQAVAIVQRLGPEQALVFKEGLRSVLGEKVHYYRERVFQERCIPPADVPELVLQPAVERFAEREPEGAELCDQDENLCVAEAG